MTHNQSRNRRPGESNMNTQILERLDELIKGQNLIKRMIGRSFQGIMTSVDDLGELVMKEVDDMNAELEGIETVGDALIVQNDRIFAMLLEQLPNSAQNAELKAAIATVTGRLKAQKEETAAAILRNTPSDPGISTGGVA